MIIEQHKNRVVSASTKTYKCGLKLKKTHTTTTNFTVIMQVNLH